MKDNQQFFHVNWVDGMKINKDLFIAQDNAHKKDLFDLSALALSSIKYGVLPSNTTGRSSFNITISTDAQDTVRVSILSCHAITLGGAPIYISAAENIGIQNLDSGASQTFQIKRLENESVYWVVLMVNPFDRQPVGQINIEEIPPRLPFVLPSYSLKVVAASEIEQYILHPYSLTIGKILNKGASLRVDEHYIPPCISVTSHPQLMDFFGDLESFLNRFETLNSKIIRKIYLRKQKNDLSDMVLFLCERTLLNLNQSITHFRWTLIHEPPAYFFEKVAALARVMKNTLDLYIDTGKDILINYFSEWVDPKQGEIERILINMMNERYDHNDINKTINVVISFANFIIELFEVLNNLEFIGKRKEGYVIDEKVNIQSDVAKPKPSSRFLS